MTITKEFSQLNQKKLITEIVFKIRADIEYTFRVLEEQILSIENSMIEPVHDSVSEIICIEETTILGKIQGLKNDLNASHKEYLTIEGGK